MLTTQDIADAIGVTRRAVLFRAKVRGIRPRMVGRSAVWTPANAKAIGKPPGRPKPRPPSRPHRAADAAGRP